MEFGAPNFQSYLSYSEDQQFSHRNNYVYARMYAIDLNFSEFERRLQADSSQLDVAGSVANIALTQTSTLIAPVGTKNILTSVAAGLTGTQAAYEQKVFLGKTVQLLESQMELDRNRQATQIYQRLRLPASQYSLYLALSDLETYYQAGTMANAQINISHDVGERAIASSDEKAQTVLEATPSADTNYQSLIKFLYPNGAAGKIDQDRRKYLKSLFLSPAELMVVIQSSSYRSAREALVSCANLYLKSTPCKPKTVALQ
ncbi:hypothetical protein NKH54_26355 [Mesorhizobium sp. M1004]|uniref:hypothetical protein n=1 Tax=Mesorhizobium sp. M1004 TaxID=2957046 RepID=UPI00333B1323